MRYFKLNAVSASEAASVLTALRGTVCIDAISGVVFMDRDPLSRCGQTRDNPTLAELMSPPAPDAECAKLTRVLIPVSVQPQKYSVCNKNVMGLLERRYRVAAREQVETA
ncbi:hypothetical protein, partial [Pyrobaculum sp.]|uniref:hypothetical protein n=1 Tax=Pyrobaculum sp. TaxID=2004705 RepID=UPI003D0EA473